MLDEETKELIKNHLIEHFPDENEEDVQQKMNFMLSLCYKAYEDSVPCIALQPIGGSLCLVFREDTGEYAGVQPWDYVQKEWEEVL